MKNIHNQEEILIQQHLIPDGVCLIRNPIVRPFVRGKYEINWVELDLSRHLNLHSLKSLKLLARIAGLDVFDIQYDTTTFEFYGRNISLIDENSPWINSSSSLFAKEEMDDFKILSNKINQTGQSGRADFFLRKVHA
jgi:hypothetical protein